MILLQDNMHVHSAKVSCRTFFERTSCIQNKVAADEPSRLNPKTRLLQVSIWLTLCYQQEEEEQMQPLVLTEVQNINSTKMILTT